MARPCPAALALIILLTAAASGAADTDAPAPVVRQTLPTGLQLTLAHDPLTDLAAFHLALEISAADLPREQAGLPEVIQQLLLNRLRATVVEGEQIPGLSDALAAGATLAISAESEYAEAQAAVPSALLPAVLQQVTELFFGPQQFSQDELDAAKTALVRAYQESLSSAATQTFRLFERALHGDSPLAHDVSTVLSGIAAVTADDVQDCRSRLYLPSRACLAVVAPEPHDRLLAMVNQALAKYPGGDQPPQPITIRLPTESTLRVGNGAGMMRASLIIGVPLPPYGTREFVAGQVAYMLLAGPQGRLTQDQMLRQGFGLVLPQHLQEIRPAFEVVAPSPMHMPFIAVHVVAAPAYIEDARLQVLGHVEAVRRRHFTEDELQAAKAQLINQYALAYNTYLSRAQMLNLNGLFSGDPQLLADFPSVLASVTAQDVVSVAEDYFAHHAIGLQMPGD